MKNYYIIKDGRITAVETSKKRALDKIRELQAQETHFMLRANFELLAEDPAFIPPEVSPRPVCWHIIKDNEVKGSVCYRNDLEDFLSRRSVGQGVSVIFGKLESVSYRRCRR